MSNPMISVILPTYKPGDYILDCLASLSRQDCPKNLFEVIIVLNGEKDPYYEFIQDALKKTGDLLDVKLLYTLEKGVSNARSYGLDQSTGEYITFLDDDDFLSQNYLSGLYETMLNQNEEARNSTLVCSNLKTFDGKSYGEDYIGKAFKKCSSGGYSIVKYRQFLSGIAGKLIPKQVISKIRFKNEFSIGEDSIFLFELSKNIGKMVLTEKDVYYVRRIREGSAITSKRSAAERFSILMRLSSVYTKIYFKAPFKYNFILYSTRMLAAFIDFLSSILKRA